MGEAEPPEAPTNSQVVGFFLETYAHVLKKDDREAIAQAASFLLGPRLFPISDVDHEA